MTGVEHVIWISILLLMLTLLLAYQEHFNIEVYREEKGFLLNRAMELDESPVEVFCD